MRKTTKLLIATVLATLLTAPAFADSLKYLGPSSATAQGDEGVLGFNALCQATFKSSQFCNSSDILRSGSIASATSTANGMWVKPDIRGFVLKADGSAAFAIDASGRLLARTSGRDPACAGWTSLSADFSGLLVLDAGGFSLGTCDIAREAACCKVKDN